MMKNLQSAGGVFALALCLTATSCTEDLTGFDAKRNEYVSKFDNLVMGDYSIDPHQTWNASVPTQLSVSAAAAGTVKVFTANPFGQSSAPLLTSTIGSGETQTLTVARPQGVTRLYVACEDAEGYMNAYAVDANADNLAVSFADQTAQKGRTRAAAGSLTSSSFSFPSAPDDGYFLSEVPEGVDMLKKESAGWHWGPNGEVIEDYDYSAASGVFYVEDVDGEKINIWTGGEGTKLYIKGNCKPSSFYVGDGSEVYILEGASLTLPADAEGNVGLQKGCAYYVADKATLTASGALKLNTSATLYNRGTIEAPKLEVNGGSLFYNQATVTLSGNLSVENKQSAIVNDGDITAKGYQSHGSGHFQNNATVVIDGDTEVDSNGNSWVNNGQYTTRNFYFRGVSENVINNCRLTVLDDFNIQLGSSGSLAYNGFRMDAGCGVDTKNLTMLGPSNIFMGANALLKVSGTATMGIATPNVAYGIHGPASGDPAVFQAKAVVKAERAVNGSPIAENQSHMTGYYDQLIVAADSHFENTSVSPEDVIAFGGGAKMVNAQTGANVTIAPTECNSGYEGTGRQREDPTMYYFYAFEDLGATGDFDFNDVVLAVTAPVDGTSDVYLMAAGGTLPVVVRLDGQQLGDEVHQAFGEATGVMVNTTRVDHPFVKLGEAHNVADPSALDLSIVVTGSNTSREVTAPVAGDTPLMIRVPGNADGKWFWPTERTNIVVPYSGFGAWGASYETNADWYLNPGASVVNY